MGTDEDEAVEGGIIAVPGVVVGVEVGNNIERIMQPTGGGRGGSVGGIVGRGLVGGSILAGCRSIGSPSSEGCRTITAGN
jgi:hypothetical protein